MNSEQLIEKIKDNELDWENFFNDLTGGFAILQVRNDLPERRDIHFCSYDEATKYLQRNPCRDDYSMLYAEELTEDKYNEIITLNSKYDKNTAIGDYVYEKFNCDNRPNISDGYYGTSLSVSDIVLIKENNSIHALYVDRFGFKELEDFEPYKFLSQEEHLYENDYRMLSRLKSDCEYFLGEGNADESKLWAGSIDEQISKMQDIYYNLPVKPEWCSEKDIAEIGKKMKIKHLEKEAEYYLEEIDELNDLIDSSDNVWMKDCSRLSEATSNYAALLEEIDKLKGKPMISIDFPDFPL